MNGLQESTGPSDTEAVLVEEPTEEVRELFGMAFSAAEQFALMLQEQGELRGLLGPRELPRLWSRHIVNSAAVVPFLPSRGTVADIGSGAGFPGVIVALMRPDLDITLIDGMERRTQWLNDVVDELGLDNVTVRRGRAEEIKDRYDVVTARAVANMSKLVRIAAPLLRPGGRLLALKGARAEEEIDKAKHVISKYRLSHPVVHEVACPDQMTTTVVELRHSKKGRGSASRTR